MGSKFAGRLNRQLLLRGAQCSLAGTFWADNLGKEDAQAFRCYWGFPLSLTEAQVSTVPRCRYGELQGRQLTSDLSALSLPDPAASDDMESVVSAMQRSIPEAVRVRRHLRT